MTQRDDRELEQYLAGDSKLSKRYRDASAETSPPDVDEAILARSRAELRRKPNLNRVLAPFAVAASLVLAVNLGWNVYKAAPPPGEAMVPKEKQESRDLLLESPSVAPAPPEAATELESIEVTGSRIDDERVEAERDAALVAKKAQNRQQARSEERAVAAQESAGYAAPAAAPSAALAPSALADSSAPPMTEAAKVDRLIDYIRTLEGAVFIRNGKEHGPAEAAGHLQLKREKAGDRIKTAGDFIRLCASHSSLSGEAYLIRFADGRTRTAEDVLREELARINAAN